MNYQKKILVIDQDQSFIDAITEAFSHYNYNVSYANDGTAGIQKALELNPDLILCEIDLLPINGWQVFTILNDSFMLKRTPFIFLKQNASIDDIRHGMNQGADDFFIKPVNIDNLVNSIEIRIHKFKTNHDEFSNEFNTLFQLSPIGIILFSKHTVFRANQFAKSLIKIDPQSPVNLSIEDLFESSSLPMIKNWIHHALKGEKAVFNGKVKIKDLLGEELKMNLTIHSLSNPSNFNQFIGFLNPVPITSHSVVNDRLANQVCNLLKNEKTIVAKDLDEKIHKIIKPETNGNFQQNNSFFTRRENQVLSLSMEGLPIKIIADQLSISTRTVEKYRTKLMEKSGANNIIEVIIFSLKNGLIKI